MLHHHMLILYQLLLHNQYHVQVYKVLIHTMQVYKVLIHDNKINNKINNSVLHQLHINRKTILNNSTRLHGHLPHALVTRHYRPALRSQVTTQIRYRVNTRFQIFVNSFHRRSQVNVKVLRYYSNLIVVGRHSLFP